MYRTKMAKRCSKRRGARVHRRTRRGGMGQFGARGANNFLFEGGGPPCVLSMCGGGGRKKMMRTRRRTRRGGHVVPIVKEQIHV